MYDLNDTGIRGCQACDYCRKEKICIIKDKLQFMYSDIDSADGIIISSPIYMSYFSGQAKIWFDRLRPMFGHDFKPRYPGKKVMAVFAQAADNEDFCSNLFESLKNLSNKWFCFVAMCWSTALYIDDFFTNGISLVCSKSR